MNYYIFILLSFLFFSSSLCLETCQPFNIGPPPSGPPIPGVPGTFLETYVVKEINDPFTQSKCLDGSKYKFLFTQGQGSGQKKWMFYWEGGAYCGYEGIDPVLSCSERATTPLGTSTIYPDDGETYTYNWPFGPMGYFSSLEEYNADFWNWNKVLIHYCDGSNHQGHLDNPIDFNGQQLWFRGYDNTNAVLKYAKRYLGLNDATDIMLTGSSAGGQATYIWTNYLQTYFPDTVKLTALSDAGFFMDTYNIVAECHFFRNRMQLLAGLTNSANSEVFRPCKYFRTNDIWKCMIAQYIVEDIHVPMFIVNSQDDVSALPSQVGLSCINQGPSTCSQCEVSIIAMVRAELLGHIDRIREKKPQWGFWLRTCFEHVYQSTMAWYGETMDVFNEAKNNYISLKDGLHQWYNGGNLLDVSTSIFIDVLDWESNPNCQLI